ncbi:LytTR family DNA-binding domain-containing protein [Kitasatospora purpeofusca]|uniref:LytR/AlgR family response regulator transcription factor n=1 Tax=Kitasatospora TaxID=2063 RepID=UPI0022594A9D|nr:LytTR family DNA-binding domain-containing protein [Kitasatospora purpeofusca]MCX4682903.1 LytTR family DNA-binding domain-containing protein [Kitasatospora purpeofusca]
MLRVLAVDDEAPALEELLYLLRADPRVRSAEGAGGATEALLRLSRALDAGPDGPEAVDVVFLDIHMPGLTGLDMAKLIAGFARPPLIVFVTAHENFAVAAFDLKAVDYVLKPVRRERLAEAVRRAGELAEAAREGAPVPADVPPEAPSVTAGNAPPGGPAEYIQVDRAGVSRLVPLADIAYVEAHGDYARLHTADGDHLVRIPLAVLEERWAPHGFVRIHRSHLVALGRIDELRLDSGATTVRIGTTVLAVSRRHGRHLRDLLIRRAHG